jgi:nickel-type superoxide dismutase maturation protease
MAGHAIRVLAGALAVVAAQRALRPQRVVVTGRSMQPALEPGDRLLAWRGRVRVGGIVVLPDPRDPRRPLVKRVRARRGDRIDVRGDHAAASTDSRAFGAVPVSVVEGVVRYRYAPPRRQGWLAAAGSSAAARRAWTS